MKDQDIQVEFEEPPGHERPPYPWEDAPLAQWNNWRWQLFHGLNTGEQHSARPEPHPERPLHHAVPDFVLPAWATVPVGRES